MKSWQLDQNVELDECNKLCIDDFSIWDHLGLIAGLELSARSPRPRTNAQPSACFHSAAAASAWGMEVAGPPVSSSPNLWQILSSIAWAATWAASHGVCPSELQVHPIHAGLPPCGGTTPCTANHYKSPVMSTSHQEYWGGSVYPTDCNTLQSRVGMPNSLRKVSLGRGEARTSICGKK